MGSSYFITYGGNRVTFPGTPGPVAYEHEDTMVLLNNGIDYMKMRFVTPDAQEIIIEDGTGVQSASGYVPVGSTAYWTAYCSDIDPDNKWFVSGLKTEGFGSISADTAVTTAVYENPYHTAYGSAILVAQKSASAQTDVWSAHKATFGEGGANYHVAFSASSFVGDYLSPLGTSLRTAWIPDGSKVLFSASSMSGVTYSLNPSATALDNFDISWNHQGSGSRMDVTGNMATPIPFRLGSGRPKRVYGTGTAYQLSNTSAKSASVWRAYTVATAISSNLNTGSAAGTYLSTWANATGINGFAFRKELGQMKNSAGTWITISGSDNRYVWKFVTSFTSMSGTMSGSFSAVRAKGGTANTTATASICAYHSASGSYNTKTGTFKAPTASGHTATTALSVSTSVTGIVGAQANVCNMFQSNIAQSTNLFSNCRGVWTASGVVI